MYSWDSKSIRKIKKVYSRTGQVHRRTGRVSFRGTDVIFISRIFFHSLHENQVDLPEYYLIFLPESGYLKNSRGKGGCSPPQTHGPYAYGQVLNLSWNFPLNTHFMNFFISYYTNVMRTITLNGVRKNE